MKSAGGDLQLAENQPSPREPGALGRIIRIADAGPRYFYRSAVVSLAVTALLTIPIALYVRPAGALPRPQRYLIAGAVIGLCVAAALGLAAAWAPSGKRGWLDRALAPEQRAAIWLSLTVWFPLLLIVAYLKAKATLPSTTVWLAFGYLDKRWVTGSYLLGVLAPMPLLVAATRVIAASRDHPATWRAWLAALAPAPGTASPRPSGGAEENVAPRSPASGPPTECPTAADDAGTARGWRRLARSGTVRVTAGILTAVAIGWYFYGPPWYLDRTKAGTPIGYQEDVFLSGFQAIAHGAVPYIGPAATQYGPGAQLLSYWYLRGIGPYSIVGFRESWALFEWVGASILFVVFFLAFGYLRGLLVAVVSAVFYPALQEMGFFAGQTYEGFYGWANPLRYVGAVALVLLLPAAIRRGPARRGPARRGLAAAGVLGLFFGAMSFVAQENLLAGIAGALVVGALLLLTGSAPLRSVLTTLLSAFIGFMIVWTPALAYYAVKGTLARFVYLYFLIPQAVAGGYSNTPYGGVNPPPAQAAIDDPWRTFYYAIPFLLAIVALLVVVRLRPLRIAENWSRERITLVATVVTTILLYQGALLRSDAAHLFGTELIFPALVIMTATALPQLIGGWRREVLAGAGVLIFVASFLLFPFRPLQYPTIRGWVTAPLLDRQRLAAEPSASTPTTLAGQRVGTGLASAASCCQGTPVPMRDFLQLMNQIHHLVGTRTTYVVDFPDGYPGIVYFVADLAPAPISLDPHTMVMTEQEELAYLEDFRTRVMPRTYALVTSDLKAPEVRFFRRAYPQAQIIRLAFGRQPYYVLLRPR